MMAANGKTTSYARILRTFAVLVALFLLAVAYPGAARAGQDDARRVRVGYYENEVFQEGAQEDAVKSGYAYEYYRKISEYTGWEYEYVYGSYSDLYKMLLDGDIDLLAGLAWKEERAGVIGYPDAPMGNESYNLIKHEADDSITAHPATLEGKTIGVLDSALSQALDAFLAGHGITANVVLFSDYEDLFAAFDSRRLDVAAVEGAGTYSRDYAATLYSFGSSDYYLCVNAARPDLLEELNEAQAQLLVEEPNYINSLRIKYYPATVSARAFSDSERRWIDAHSTLRVGYLLNYLPYSDQDGQGQVTGFVKDLLPDMFAAMGLDSIEFAFTGYKSYDAMIADVTSGAIDVAFPVGGGLYYSEQSGIYQSSTVASSSTELVYHGEFTEETTSTFAVNENNRMQYYYVRANYPDAEIVFYPSIDDCLSAVLADEAGCTTLNGLRVNDILRNASYKNLSMRQTSRNDDRCFGVDIGNEGLLKLLNRGISILGSDYAQYLSYRYTEGLYSRSLYDAIMDHALLFGGFFAAIAAAIIALLVRDARHRRRELKEIEAASMQLEAKNCELAQSQQALSVALDSAERASQAKTAFLNSISHDIRTPMNAIVGFTALAQSHLDDTGLVSDHLAKIAISSKHLLSLINNVLDMSRIESGKMRMEETETNLIGLVDDLRAIMQSGAGAKNIELIVDAQGVEHEHVVTDKLRLTQVLLNILGNAVKFTPEGGRIEFNIAEEPADDPAMAVYRFTVSDTGIGMSEEFRNTIFDAFTRASTSTVSGIQGTGLGMSISKGILDMMGGTIDVQSEEGEGSVFTVRVPCRISQAAQEESREAEEMPSRDFSGKRVLLTEDNAMNQAIATMILEEHGFAVEVAANGSQAVEMMQDAPAGYYDVVLMDIQMPVMDGYEATRRIRSLDEDEKAAVPIIAVTANAFEEDANTALSIGMNGHLAKPYDVPSMLAMLDRLLQ